MGKLPTDKVQCFPLKRSFLQWIDGRRFSVGVLNVLNDKGNCFLARWNRHISEDLFFLSLKNSLKHIISYQQNEFTLNVKSFLDYCKKYKSNGSQSWGYIVYRVTITNMNGKYSNL